MNMYFLPGGVAPIRYCLRFLTIVLAISLFVICIQELMLRQQIVAPIPTTGSPAPICHNITVQTTTPVPVKVDFTIKPLCTDEPPDLGPISDLENFTTFHNDNETELVLSFLENPTDLKLGGYWEPVDCTARYRTAIVIPYRNRLSHLHILLSRLHPLLQKQLIAYRIFVAEQEGNGKFNKGRIMNTAVMHIRSRYPQYDCVLFHDVDMIPEDDRNMYACSHRPKHLSPAVNEMNYTLPYKELVGGVFAVPIGDYIRVNGYSNYFWGWGGEDDDMYSRLEAAELTTDRSPMKIGRYTMINHKKRIWEKPYKYVQKLLKSSKKRYLQEGLAQIQECGVAILNVEMQPAYTHILIDIGPETVWNRD